MYAKVNAGAVVGMEGMLVNVEVDYRSGLSHFAVVGLGDKAVQEARERVMSAVRNVGWDVLPQRIVVNLAPAHVPKSGAGYDLAMAVGLLAAAELLPSPPADFAFIGELTLEGKVMPVRGVLPLVLGLMQQGIKRFVLSVESLEQLGVVKGGTFFAIGNISELKVANWESLSPALPSDHESTTDSSLALVEDVKGQMAAKYALLVAAAGGHHLLFSGIPGSGKTMLARTLPGLLPELSQPELLTVACIKSLAAKNVSRESLLTRSFRSPHHNMSVAALVGGGSDPRPGEVTLAHNGVLFLDELPEFSRAALDALRQPLEEKQVVVSRATHTVVFPADFQLIAAMNPCKCGYLGAENKRCTCLPKDVKYYRSKVSGPIMDRIDIKVVISAIDWDHQGEQRDEFTTQAMRGQVELARKAQASRQAGKLNSCLSLKELQQFGGITLSADQKLKQLSKTANLSMRGYVKVLRIARTIADLRLEEEVKESHVMAALQLRAEATN